ncbi:MAG TPA: hypothetical protein QF753_01975 [Victivallales bacterium]|nr:hypothetical protein [Victivallales bacterium]
MKEIILFFISFIPWLLFLFISGHSLYSLELAILICLSSSLIFNYRELRKFYILQWGTFVFFITVFIAINLLKIVWFAEYMSILSNSFLAGIVWFTILIGKPFTLQYARADLPKEKWNDIKLIKGSLFIAKVWGILFLFSLLASILKISLPNILPQWIYTDITLVNIVLGIVFTKVYKHYKRKKKELQR